MTYKNDKVVELIQKKIKEERNARQSLIQSLKQQMREEREKTQLRKRTTTKPKINLAEDSVAIRQIPTPLEDLRESHPKNWAAVEEKLGKIKERRLSYTG